MTSLEPSIVIHGALTVLCLGALMLIVATSLAVHMAARLTRECARLKRYALIDDVTDLYPRHYGMSRLRELLRAKVPGGLVFVDLDDFGFINKRLGWQMGDAVLHNAANLLRSVARREIDVALRYGGDELLVFIAGDEKTFHALAACLQVRFRTGLPQMPNGQRPTGTTGAAYVRPEDPDGWNLTALIKHAQDEARARKEQRTR